MQQDCTYNVQDIDDSFENEHSPSLDAVHHDRGSISSPRMTSERQPSISQPGTPRTPRTANRVRFDLRQTSHATDSEPEHVSEQAGELSEQEDYFSQAGTDSSAQREPLLTGIEAPSLTAALEIHVDDLLEIARPKSGMSSAFMNMANSIIGAGIIGRDLWREIPDQ